MVITTKVGQDITIQNVAQLVIQSDYVLDDAIYTLYLLKAGIPAAKLEHCLQSITKFYFLTLGRLKLVSCIASEVILHNKNHTKNKILIIN